MSSTRRWAAAVLLTCTAVAGCGTAGTAGTTAAAGAGSSSTADGDPSRPEVTVLAAASMAEVLTGLADSGAADAELRLSFAGSSTVVAQAMNGAPAGVLVTASPATMQRAVDAGVVAGEPVVVARNRLQLVVPAGNPGGVTGLHDLADPDLLVALCAPRVPCGATAQAVLDAADVDARPDTLERDVKAVLTKVALGEVDVGLVYRTDVRAAGDAVEPVADPAVDTGREAITDYPAAVLAAAPEPAAAADVVALLRSPEGQAALRAAGFEVP